MTTEDSSPEAVISAPEIVIITGLSGAGRSEAAHCLEDLGYFVVDNLPPALLPKMAELTTRPPSCSGCGRLTLSNLRTSVSSAASRNTT